LPRVSWLLPPCLFTCPLSACVCSCCVCGLLSLLWQNNIARQRMKIFMCTQKGRQHTHWWPFVLQYFYYAAPFLPPQQIHFQSAVTEKYILL
jgi:hypothetical protein